MEYQLSGPPSLAHPLSFCQINWLPRAVARSSFSNLCLVACGMFVNYLPQLFYRPTHWPKCLPIILLRHTVRMCIISCCSCSAGNVLRASSWANFSLLLQLRVRHFRIATVIILITNTKALNFIPSSPPVPPFWSLPSLRRKLIFIWRDSASNWLQRRRRQRPVSFCVWHFKWANWQREMS